MPRFRESTRAVTAISQAPKLQRRVVTTPQAMPAVANQQRVAAGVEDRAQSATMNTFPPAQRRTFIDRQKFLGYRVPQAFPNPRFNVSDAKEKNYLEVSTYMSEMDELFINKTGGEIFHEMMLRKGVEHIFGYPGGAIFPILHAIHESKGLDFVLSKHEQGAGHMAQGYARASGKHGIVLVTSGPGATNFITPIQDAMSDGNPLVLFTGQVPTSALGSDAFQECDVIGISKPCTKWNIMVQKVEELPRVINQAFDIATSGRPGPVLIDIPLDVSASILRSPVPIEPPVPSLSSTQVAGITTNKELQQSFERIGKLIDMAKKPIIYAGQGVISSPGGVELLRELSEKASIPVTTTLLGLGAFDELDEKSLCMLGMHGSAFANMAMQEADLILAIGARFDDRVTAAISKFAPAAKAAALEGRGGFVHFDILPKNINKVVQATEAIVGDVGESLSQLLPYTNTTSMSSRPDWFKSIKEWKEKWPISDYNRTERPNLIKPQTLIEQLSNLVSKETIITTGVGQHQMWAAQHFRWRYPRTMITSGSHGTMGFGLPAAIGAKIARPEALVIDIDGDGSFGMTLTELSTAAQLNIDVKIIVLNNDEMGMATSWQSMFFEDRFAATHQKNPDFVKLADAMGIQHRRLVQPDDSVEALQWLIGSNGPALLEVRTDSKVPLFPLVPTGAGLHEFLVWDSEEDKKRREMMRIRTGGLYQ